jgi:hypothetical protein
MIATSVLRQPAAIESERESTAPRRAARPDCDFQALAIFKLKSPIATCSRLDIAELLAFAAEVEDSVFGWHEGAAAD